MRVGGMFNRKLQIMDRGTTTPASRISSPIWQDASDPTTVNITPTCPTQSVRPIGVQPPPLSIHCISKAWDRKIENKPENSVNTDAALCLTGVIAHRTATITIQSVKCRTAK